MCIKSLQEDLAANDVEEIIDDLIAGKTPKAGPRYASYIYTFYSLAG